MNDTDRKALEVVLSSAKRRLIEKLNDMAVMAENNQWQTLQEEAYDVAMRLAAIRKIDMSLAPKAYGSLVSHIDL